MSKRMLLAISTVLLCQSMTGCTATPPPPDQHTVAPTPSPTPTFGDRGAQKYAEGTARRIGQKDFLYLVAKGDTAEGVAARFGSTVDRVSGGSRGGRELFEGDELRFGPPAQ